MIVSKKPLIAMAALIAVGLAAAIDMAQSGSELAPAAAVAQRFPGADEIMAVRNIGKSAVIPAPVVNPAKSDRLAPRECVHEHWPYIADECLMSSDGAKSRKPTRTIAIERRVASADGIATR